MPVANPNMPVVIKIGGSVFNDLPLLTHLCEEVSCFNSGQLAVVAGGGAFADCVRNAQAKLKFNDETAHAMAILAMEQNGLVLTDRIDQAVAVSNLDQFALAWADRKIPVWMPAVECSADRSLDHTWAVTSDAIAARLAERLGGAGVILLKACTVDPAWSLDEMTGKEIIDPVFPKIVKRASLAFSVVGANNDRSLDFISANLHQNST